MFSTRPCVAEHSLLYYPCVPHPEFFHIVASKQFSHLKYDVTLWLTSTGHVFSLVVSPEDGRRLQASEVVISSHIEIPRRCVFSQIFASSQQKTQMLPSEIYIETQFQQDIFSREAFCAIQQELAAAHDIEGLMYRFVPNGRLPWGAVSFALVEKRASKVSLRSCHTFPDDCKILTTTTVFSWDFVKNTK